MLCTGRPGAAVTGAQFVAIGLISAAILAFEVLLMRLYAIVGWHHFAYMMISIALLGFGASGTALALARRSPCRPFPGRLRGLRGALRRHGDRRRRAGAAPALQPPRDRMGPVRSCSGSASLTPRCCRRSSSEPPRSDSPSAASHRRSAASTPATWSAPGSGRPLSSACSSCCRRRRRSARSPPSAWWRRCSPSGRRGGCSPRSGSARRRCWRCSGCRRDGRRCGPTSPSTRVCRWR